MSPAYPVHHAPYALVPPVPDLTLHLTGRQPFHGEAHERHGHVSFPDRQLGTLHHRTATKSGPEIAVGALPLPFGLEPPVLLAMAFLTDHSFPLTHGPKMLPTASLIREMFNEL